MIDIHCHLEKMRDPLKIIKEIQNRNINVITSCASIEDADKTLEFAKNKNIFCSLGLHPTEVIKLSDKDIENYIELIKNNSKDIVAIGEVGLDYKWISNEKDQTKTKEVFIKFIKLSKELNLPIVIHSRNSMNDCLKILDENEAKKVVIHCFSGNAGQLKYATELGYFISINTILTKNKNIKQAVKKVQMNKMLLETDSPWMDPKSVGELTNVPWNIETLISEISKIKGISKLEVENITDKNAVEFFGL